MREGGRGGPDQLKVYRVHATLAEHRYQLRRVMIVKEKGHAARGNGAAVSDCSNWMASCTASGSTRYHRAISSIVSPAAEIPARARAGTPDTGSIGWPKARAGSRTTRRPRPSG